MRDPSTLTRGVVALQAWFFGQDPKLSRGAFAKRCGLDRRHVSRIIDGDVRLVRPETAKRLADGTEGAVEVDWFWPAPSDLHDAAE